MSVSTNSLTFTANGPSDPTPTPKVVVGHVSNFTGQVLYVNITGTGQAIAAISPVTIDNSAATGSATVSVPAPASLGVGTYTGTITVKACTSDIDCASGNLTGSPQTISVTYYVAAIQSSSASLDFVVGAGATASTQSTTITGVPAQSWAATTNANWLAIPASGATGTALSASLVSNVVDGMNNGTYTGTVTVTPGTAGHPVAIPVSLTINRTQVNYVSPYVGYTGTGGDVIIRGDRLPQTGIQNVMFGSTPADSFNWVSATEIHAHYPSTLAPGRYNVSLQGIPGIGQFADLVIVDPPQFTATVLQYPDTASLQATAMVYDAERAALGVVVHMVSTGATSFFHFSSNASAWQTGTATPLMNTFGLALMADGKDWIAGADRSVTHINATSLVTGATTTSPIPGSSTLRIDNFAVSNDGTVAMFGDVYFNCGDAILYLYNPRKQIFTQPGYTACRGTVGASGDGSKLLIPNQFLVPPHTDDVYSLNTTTGAATPTGLQLLTPSGVAPSLNRDGSRIVLDKTHVYDGQYNPLGDLPTSTDAVVLSPDGTRAYAFDHSGTMKTYDLTGALVAGIYPQLSATTLAGDPGPASTITPALYSNAVVAMTITPDGRTVFIAGSKGVVVQPAP